MKKSKIADTLYVPIKDGKYLLNGKGIVRVYKSMEILEKYCKDYDDTIIYNKKKENNMKKEIVNYLLECGIKPHIKGFNYLHRAIEITMANDNAMPPVTKILYPQIAEEFNDASTRVERAIRHAIQTANQGYKYMSNGEFIARASIVISFASK